MTTFRMAGVLLAVLLLGPASLPAQQVQPEEYVLDNGLKVLLLPRPGEPTVAAGWLAKVGSVNERPGITGVSHLFEHMMFKGTRVIGTTDIAEDLRLMERMDAVKAELRVHEEDQVRRLRVGEIADLDDPASRSPRHQELIEEMAELDKLQKSLIVTNEFDRIYTSAGASGMNAGTSHDFTVYFITVPANKLELWFWMESDRLLNPVFREFYAEREVVAEERRMRIDSTPTGRFEEQFDAMFWAASPYGWPVIGWPSDIGRITREEALAYYDLNYAPNNLVAALVGGFEPAEAKALAEKYFGRLERNPQSPPPVRTREPEPLAEKRMIAHAETNPTAVLRYHSVADGHRDEPALVVLGSLLSGRTGRLYRALVLDQQIATAASAAQNGLKYEGFFSVNGVAKPGVPPEQVEEALGREIERIKEELVGERELEKVKNRFAADNYRRLQSSFALLLQLLISENNRGWESLNTDPKAIDAVTAEDVQRVAREHLEPERRAVALYYTKRPDPAETTPDPLLEGLSDEERAQVRQFRSMLEKMPTEQAQMMLQQFEQQAGAAPPEKRKLLDVLRTLLQQRIGKDEQ
jgi:predicted Zn-dependent peptidase